MESNRNGNLELCSKPLRFQTKQLKAMKSSGEKEHWTWTASEPFLSIRSVSFLLLPLPTSPRLFQGTPLPAVLVPLWPSGRQGQWWKGRRCASSAQEPQASLSLRSSVWSGLSLCFSAPRLQPTMLPCVPSSIPWCFCGCLRCHTWLPASPSLCVPLPPHSCSLQQKQPPSTTLLHPAYCSKS